MVLARLYNNTSEINSYPQILNKHLIDPSVVPMQNSKNSVGNYFRPDYWEISLGQGVKHMGWRGISPHIFLSLLSTCTPKEFCDKNFTHTFPKDYILNSSNC